MVKISIMYMAKISIMYMAKISIIIEKINNY